MIYLNQYRVSKWAVRDWRVMRSVGEGRSVTVSQHTTTQGARAACRKLNTGRPVAVVSADIAEAFGMTNLPNVIVTQEVAARLTVGHCCTCHGGHSLIDGLCFDCRQHAGSPNEVAA